MNYGRHRPPQRALDWQLGKWADDELIVLGRYHEVAFTRIERTVDDDDVIIKDGPFFPVIPLYAHKKGTGRLFDEQAMQINLG